MSNFVQRIIQSRFWRSFFRHGWPDNPLDRSLVMTTNIFFHLHPVGLVGQLLRHPGRYRPDQAIHQQGDNTVHGQPR